MFKINWKVRFTKDNMTFILRFLAAIVIPILTYFGLEFKDFTTWKVVGDILLSAIQNPYVVFFTVINAFNVLFDPTTTGFSDSEKALDYTIPKANTKSK